MNELGVGVGVGVGSGFFADTCDTVVTNTTNIKTTLDANKAIFNLITSFENILSYLIKLSKEPKNDS